MTRMKGRNARNTLAPSWTSCEARGSRPSRPSFTIAIERSRWPSRESPPPGPPGLPPPPSRTPPLRAVLPTPPMLLPPLRVPGGLRSKGLRRVEVVPSGKSGAVAGQRVGLGSGGTWRPGPAT
jgi:hypothetical protein